MLTLPRGAGAGNAFGAAIASDPAKLGPAVHFWRKQLHAVGEDVMDTGAFTSKALTFAAVLPDAQFASLVREFAGFFADEEGMIKRSGCLMSTSNLASSTGASNLAGILRFLGSFDTSGRPSAADTTRLATALRVAREVWDLVRRFEICGENARTARVPRSELLSIYQQEGALGIAPPQTSWPFAPLIPTTDDGCRAHAGLVWDGLRHGFVVSHARESAITPSTRDPVSLRFGIAVRHVVMVAGLDSLIDPRLVAEDELLALYSCARAQPAGTYLPLDTLKRDVLAKLSRLPSVGGTIAARQRRIDSQADIFDGLCLGMAMALLEPIGKRGDLPSEAGLFSDVATQVRKLVDAHPAILESSGRVFLAPTEDYGDARSALALQATWYSQRRRVVTLLARRDRDGYRGPAELHPILAYLRYNIGEFNFVRCLIHFANRIKDLKKPRAARDIGLAPAFITELGRMTWGPGEAKVADKLAAAWLRLQKTQFFDAAGWRHVGLIDALAESGPVCVSTPPTSPSMELAADAAMTVVDIYTEKGLFPLLAQFVLGHRLEVSIGKLNVVALKEPTSRETMRNAFSFERIRRVHANALTAAGIEEIPS